VPSVVCTVETRLEQGDVVRCISCHGLYEPGRPGVKGEGEGEGEGQGAGEGEGCPACGETRWLAERVPVEESGGDERA
jgi:hypothetical protein